MFALSPFLTRLWPIGLIVEGVQPMLSAQSIMDAVVPCHIITNNVNRNVPVKIFKIAAKIPPA